jgi:hypothetical protein
LPVLPDPPRLRLYGLAITLAVGSSALALVVAMLLDLPIRDPDGVAGRPGSASR